MEYVYFEWSPSLIPLKNDARAISEKLQIATLQIDTVACSAHCKQYIFQFTIGSANNKIIIADRLADIAYGCIAN